MTRRGLDRVWGRRQGKRLRARQQALLDEFLPRIAIAAPSAEGISDPGALFGDLRPCEIWLEIGYGAGEHLAAQAAAHPQAGLIGCEVFRQGIAKALARIADAGLVNIRLFEGDARRLMAALPDRSLARVFLLFPDPWPKTRHHKRRFVQVETLSEIARLLSDGGLFRVASDLPGYVCWTLERMMRHAAFEWTAEGPADWRVRPPDWPPTRYEAKAVREGRAPAYLEFRRVRR